MTEKSAFGYSSNFTAFWPTGEARFMNKAWPQRSWDFLFESAGPGCIYVLHSSLAIPLQQLLLGADKSLQWVDYHDWLTSAFARHNNYPWVINGLSSTQYRQHAHNQIGVNPGLRSFWFCVRKVLNSYGFEQSSLIAKLIGASSSPGMQHGLRGGCQGYLWLALQARQCTRKRIDQLWFFISCVLIPMFNPA